MGSALREAIVATDLNTDGREEYFVYGHENGFPAHLWSFIWGYVVYVVSQPSYACLLSIKRGFLTNFNVECLYGTSHNMTFPGHDLVEADQYSSMLLQF